MNYKPILNKLNYWKNDSLESDDNYRKENDWDCILTGGNLNADTIISLWLPLRYTLNYFDKPKWQFWKDYEADILHKQNMTLKNCNGFINDIEKNIDAFLPAHDLTRKLIRLFELGEKRCNVMILPYRKWNVIRGGKPYYDYLPHFLYNLLNSSNLKDEVVNWIYKEHLTMFFEEEIIDAEHVIDLAGTGYPFRHYPKQIQLPLLIENYINILEKRDCLIYDND